MKWAIFSDIHGNLEALETAVSYCHSKDLKRFMVLGDTVGYGANPNECFEWCLQNAETNLLGNHEKALIEPSLRQSFNDIAAIAIKWTETIFNPEFKKAISKLAFTRIQEGMTFVHSSPDSPENFRYLITFRDALPSFDHFANSICFVGHTHVPACFCLGERSATHLTPGVIELKKEERYILNPGSVGQPRDHDSRLAFGIFDSTKKTFEIVRLNYDNHKAADKIRKAGLPAYLADRLL